jgi:predicted nuclease with TOPRIM domain
MAYRLILDENVEHEVLHRLENYGHDVEHVDFVLEVGEGLYRAVLYVGDATLSVEQVADIIHAVSQNYPQAELQGLEYVGEEWL